MAGNEDAQIRYSGTERTATKAIWLTLKNVEISGLGRGIGISVPEPPAVQGQNANAIRSFHIFVEDSSLSDLTVEAIQWSQAATAALGTAGDPPVIDLGGGPLGSHGRNRFAHNGVPGYVPPGVAGDGVISQPPADGDITVTNSGGSPNPTIQIWAENNYWGGAAPSFSQTGTGSEVFVPSGSNVNYQVPRTFLPISVDPFSWAPK